VQTIDQLIADPTALFAINHSGGKDSQAMMIKLLALGIPARQIVAVHARLGGKIEHEGTEQHAQAQCDAAGIKLLIAEAFNADGSAKTFFSYARRRKAQRPDAPSFPDGSNARWCTSELKRDPINRELRRYANKHGFKAIVSCQGIRAQESDSRRKKQPFAVEDRLNCAKRPGFVWYPIFDMLVDEVFQTIVDAGQMPHPAYDLDVATMKPRGNERLSCVFCVMGSPNDLLNGALQRPELFEAYCDLEDELGYTMHAFERKPLRQIVAEAKAKRFGTLALAA